MGEDGLDESTGCKGLDDQARLIHLRLKLLVERQEIGGRYGQGGRNYMFVFFRDAKLSSVQLCRWRNRGDGQGRIQQQLLEPVEGVSRELVADISLCFQEYEL